jgi:LmbE family N-acetylglucosaminyl deacetylase
MRRFLAAAVALVTLAPCAVAQQLAPPSTGGIAALDHALGLLNQNKRVLIIAAHPDDEDTELLTLLSRGLGVDAAYLSLSRGEGGQNLIGPELGEALGLIRSGELLAARSLDGAHQFFTRGFDFGFSKSLDETSRFWPPDTILADVMRVIRRFRPQVIVAVFSGTPRDGHGQHQMSGVVARRAFELLRDSAWGPKKLYGSARFDTAAATLRIASGQLDPVEGRSYLQLAMAGRSLHRSQDMGQLQRLGTSTIRLALIQPSPGPAALAGTASGAPGDALFRGIDTSLAPGLSRYAVLIDSARALLGPRTTERVTTLLLRALAELRRAAPADFRREKEPLLEEAIANAAGVVADAVADDGRVAPEQALNASVSTWNAGQAAVSVREAEIEAPRGWSVAQAPAQAAASGEDPIRAAFTATSGVETRRFTVTAPASADPSTPYFLARPRVGALYDWSAAPDSLRGEPFDPPLLMVRVTLDVNGTAITLRREIGQRYNDQARGEVRKPVVVVPTVGVSVTPEVLVWPVPAAGTRSVTVELVHGARGRTEGEVQLELPGGWPDVPAQRFVLEGEDTRRSFTFEVRAPRTLAPGEYHIHAVATSAGRRDDRAAGLVDFPHVRPVAYVTSATVRVAAASLALPNLRSVGYVRGASDVVPELLTSVGVPVTVLGPSDLERSDLSSYEAIVIGSRAYETDSGLVANNGRLLDYVRAGGRLIVLYQQYQFVRGNFAPFPLRIASPHDRVTDETSPVREIEPGSALFHAPNEIGDADWQGWVQERGLYFAHDWDPAYRPLLEMGDNGERLQGGVLVARLGQGVYVYTGLSFFRQLPAGVPGAYRLFANLLGLRLTNVP